MYILPGALAPLAAYRQFILVRLVPRPGAPGKMDKFPTHPQYLRNHNAHDPSIWMDYPAASMLADRLGREWCVGFVITQETRVIVMDIDECMTPNGWSPHALAMLAEFPGAVEVSGSGRGLHIWAFADDIPVHGKRNAAYNMELYSDLRFIAMGSSANGHMGNVTQVLPGLIAKWFPPSAADLLPAAGWTDGPCEGHTVLEDDIALQRAMQAAPKATAGAVFGDDAPRASFADMWLRNVDVLRVAYPPKTPGKEFDASEVDYAVARELLYWTGKDCERVARMMRTSALRREKWDTHRTYFAEKTIVRANTAQPNFYKAKTVMPIVSLHDGDAHSLQPKQIKDSRFVGREELAALFKGCVYVTDENKVLLPNGDLVDQARFKVLFAGRVFIMDDDNQKTTRDAWEAFTANSIIEFPRVQGTAFDPRRPYQAVIRRAGRDWVNIYKAPDVQHAPGDVAPFINLVKKMLPNGDDALIMISYMKAIVQHVGYKWRWAIFLQGVQGNGKGTLTKILKHALGNKYVFNLKPGMIENNFNAYLEYNVLYIADDFYAAKDRTDVFEAIKTLITETDHPVTYKGIDSVQKVICGNWLFIDNHKDAQKKTEDDRRICPLYCAQQSKADRQRDGLTRKFFVLELMPWLENGGYDAVAHWLKNDPIDPRYDPTGECQEAPETSVGREAVMDGRTGLEHEIGEWIELGESGFNGDYVSAAMLKRKIENIPRFARSGGYLKLKEALGRLGYEMHRKLENGRVPVPVMPDNTRPVLFVRSGSFAASLEDGEMIARHYEQTQIRGIFK